MKTIYLSGPISGRPYEEYAAHFSRVENNIREKSRIAGTGILTVNPVRLCTINGKDAPWIMNMKTCLRELFWCSGIALLAGWEDSRGANIETRLACELHIPIVHIEPPLTAPDLISISGSLSGCDLIRYLARRENAYTREDTINPRAVYETVHRYLDPHGFEYIDISEEED
jgi:hypothetical protein